MTSQKNFPLCFNLLGKFNFVYLCSTWKLFWGLNSPRLHVHCERERRITNGGKFAYIRRDSRVWMAICILICFILFGALMRGTASLRIKNTILLHARRKIFSLFLVPNHLNFYVLSKSIFMNKFGTSVVCASM